MDHVKSHSNENKPSSEEKLNDVGGYVLGKKYCMVYGKKNALLKKAKRRSNLQVWFFHCFCCDFMVKFLKHLLQVLNISIITGIMKIKKLSFKNCQRLKD